MSKLGLLLLIVGLGFCSILLFSSRQQEASQQKQAIGFATNKILSPDGRVRDVILYQQDINLFDLSKKISDSADVQIEHLKEVESLKQVFLRNDGRLEEWILFSGEKAEVWQDSIEGGLVTLALLDITKEKDLEDNKINTLCAVAIYNTLYIYRATVSSIKHYKTKSSSVRIFKTPEVTIVIHKDGLVSITPSNGHPNSQYPLYFTQEDKIW